MLGQAYLLLPTVTVGFRLKVHELWSLAVIEFRMAVYLTQTLGTQCLASKQADTKKRKWKNNVSLAGNIKKNKYNLGHKQKAWHN